MRSDAAMRLWLLQPAKGLRKGDNPWDPWYDKVFAFVVRAESEDAARALAHAEGGDENRGEYMRKPIANTTSPWLDPKYSTCTELGPDGEAGVVIKDFAAA